jgi:hypothetical protein
MEKEEKKKSSQSADQEEMFSHSELGFLYEFFISEEKSGDVRKKAIEQPPKNKENELKFGDQSLAFFLPDFFTDET